VKSALRLALALTRSSARMTIVNWETNADVQNQMRNLIEDYLFELKARMASPSASTTWTSLWSSVSTSQGSVSHMTGFLAITPAGPAIRYNGETISFALVRTKSKRLTSACTLTWR